MFFLFIVFVACYLPKTDPLPKPFDLFMFWADFKLLGLKGVYPIPTAQIIWART